MLNPQAINPLSLPSVAVADRKQLPETPSIYFAIDAQDVIQYIGRSVNPRQRWQQHHRIGQVQECRIAYFECDGTLLDEVECALIEYFNPPLNWAAVERAVRESCTMPTRKQTAFRFDRRILEALELVAREGNISVNRYLENLLFSHMKQIGKIEMGASPLGETRGSDKGERRGAAKKGTKRKPKAKDEEGEADD
jgi:hypothetical protein